MTRTRTSSAEISGTSTTSRRNDSRGGACRYLRMTQACIFGGTTPSSGISPSSYTSRTDIAWPPVLAYAGCGQPVTCRRVRGTANVSAPGSVRTLGPRLVARPGHGAKTAQELIRHGQHLAMGEPRSLHLPEQRARHQARAPLL